MKKLLLMMALIISPLLSHESEAPKKTEEEILKEVEIRLDTIEIIMKEFNNVDFSTTPLAGLRLIDLLTKVEENIKKKALEEVKKIKQLPSEPSPAKLSPDFITQLIYKEAHCCKDKESTLCKNLLQYIQKKFAENTDSEGKFLEQVHNCIQNHNKKTALSSSNK